MDNFDKYIKKHTEADLDLPSELNWDNMNIPLPVEKKKKRRFLWLFLLGLGVVLGFGANHLLTNNPTIEPSTSKSDIVLTHENDKIAQVPSAKTVQTNNHTPTSPSANKEINTREEKRTRTKQNTASNTEITSKSNSQNIADIASTLPSNNNVNNNTTEKTAVLVTNTIPPINNSEDKHTINEDNQTYTRSSNETTKNGIAQKHLDKVSAIRPIGLSTLIQNAPLDLPTVDRLQIEKNARKKTMSFFTSYEYSYANTEYYDSPQSEALNQAVSPAYGHSINMGLRLPMSKSSFFSTEVTYQDLKSQFMYTENLGTKVDQANFQKITTLRHVCHTNSIQSLGVRLGIGKKFMLSNRWGIELTGALSSNYRIAGNGRTLDDNSSIISIEDHQFADKFQFNAHLNTGIFLELKKVKIVGILGWQRSLNKTLLIENLSIKQSSNALNFGIGIEKKI